MSQNIITRNKEGILIGLFTSFIFLIIQPFIINIGGYLILGLTNINEVFSNYFYRSLARDIYILSNYLTNTAIIIVLTLLTTVWLKLTHLKSDFDFKMIHLNTKPNESLQPDMTLDESASFNSNPFKFYKIAYGIFNGFAFFYLIIAVYISFSEKFNKRYENKLIIIKPYITTNQHDKLCSQWKLMKTKKDFMTIDSTINNIVKENKIVL